jgi:hypothetical protein
MEFEGIVRMALRYLFITVRPTYSFLIIILFAPLLLVMVVYLRLAKPESIYNRVFIGIHEISSNIHSIQETLDSFGESTTSLIETNRFSGESQCGKRGENSTRIYLRSNFKSLFCRRLYNLFVKPLILALYFIKLIAGHGTWFFIWNHTFLPFNVDLLILKLTRKKIIIMHCGDDVRYRPLQRAIDKSRGFDSWSDDTSSLGVFLYQYYFVWLSELMGEVISIRDQATFQRKPLVFFRFPMQGTIFLNKKVNNDIKRIVHAPSCRYVKGTEVVMEAIEIMKRKNLKFEFTLLEGQTNENVLLELQRTDILIDQPGNWVGRLAVEACAAGCCVVGGNRSEYNNQYDSPVIQFERNASDLAKVLTKLINDEELLSDKKFQSYEFWKKHYSPEAYYRLYQSILTGDAPTFAPLSDQREILLKASSKWYEKVILYLFYYPKFK